MLTEQPILITSVKCTEATQILKNRFVSFAGAYATPSTKALGVVNADTNEGEYVPVTAKGVAIVETGDAISLGGAIEVFDDGVAVPFSAGPLEGYAMDTASAAGQLIRILLV